MPSFLAGVRRLGVFAGAALVVTGAVASAACSSDPTSNIGLCSDYTPPATFDATTPAVSFSKDVMPIFKQSCAFSTCHGSNVGDANGVYLGDDAPRVHAAVLGVVASELPSMAFVVAGDPRASYLMRKMDGSQCALDAQCQGGSCQMSMPRGEDPLPLETRDVVRRWIAQGAKND
ncbi:hypothetical protein [Labilithrix luteola]|nr:hypothetical protein [Labilithrix luteola]